MQSIKNAAASALGSANDALQAALTSSSRTESAADHAQSLTKDITVKEILIHPIKSCRGTSVQQAEYDHAGLKYDRTWLIIDADTRRFYTARELPKMVLINPRIDEKSGNLVIEIPPTDTGVPGSTVSTPLDPTEEDIKSFELIDDITIWVHKVNGYAVSKEADERLSAYFGKPVRLVRKGPSQRPSGPTDPQGPKEWDDATVRYQDFYPWLVASAASLRHVQRTLAASVYPSLQQEGSGDIQSYKVPPSVNREYWTPEELESLPITRFRPNIIVDGPTMVPWEEDGWTSLELLDATTRAPPAAEAKGTGRGVYLLEKCARCMVPNIDPETGVRDNFLPYRVLQQYRQVDPAAAEKGKPCFGMLSVPRERTGTVKVGDIVRVTETVDPSTR